MRRTWEPWENAPLGARRVPVNGIKCEHCGYAAGCFGYITYEWTACLCPKCERVDYFQVRDGLPHKVDISPCMPMWLHHTTPELNPTPEQRKKIEEVESQWKGETLSESIWKARRLVLQQLERERERQREWEAGQPERDRQRREYELEQRRKQLLRDEEKLRKLKARVKEQRGALGKGKQKPARAIDDTKVRRALCKKAVTTSRKLNERLREAAAAIRRKEFGDVVPERAPYTLMEEVFQMFNEAACLRGLRRPILSIFRRECGDPQHAGIV